MNLLGLRQILMLGAVNLALFLAYCLVAIWLPIARLLRYLKQGA